MIKRSIFAFSLLVLTCAVLSSARAETPIVTCGVPDEAVLNTDPGGEFCDSYSRQLAYAAEAKKFSALLKERQKNFAQPGFKAVNKYRADMRAYHGYDEEESKDSASAEAFGPTEPESTEPGTTPNP